MASQLSLSSVTVGVSDLGGDTGGSRAGGAAAVAEDTVNAE